MATNVEWSNTTMSATVGNGKPLLPQWHSCQVMVLYRLLKLICSIITTIFSPMVRPFHLVRFTICTEPLQLDNGKPYQVLDNPQSVFHHFSKPSSSTIQHHWSASSSGFQLHFQPLFQPISRLIPLVPPWTAALAMWSGRTHGSGPGRAASEVRQTGESSSWSMASHG